MPSNFGGNGPPPQPNPILTQYESFLETTPLITRYILTTLFLTWVLSWFTNPALALSNIPMFTLFQFELYRVITSPLVCTSLLTLIFGFMSFLDSGKRLEFSLGSTSFLVMLLTLSIMTNITFLALCCSCYALTQQGAWLVQSCSGIWLIILGVISVECSNAPRDSQRKLFFFNVPTLYYPIAILVLFSLFAGPQLGYMIAVAIGYAYGYGYLERFRVSNATCTRWEDGCLRNFTQRKGWVAGHAATGANAWLPTTNPAASSAGGGGWQPTAFVRGQPAQQGAASSSSSSGTVASPPAGGWAAPGAVSPPPAFPSSKGKTLGGGRSASSKKPEDARAARLAALEKRNNNESNDA